MATKRCKGCKVSGGKVVVFERFVAIFDKNIALLVLNFFFCQYPVGGGGCKALVAVPLKK